MCIDAIIIKSGCMVTGNIHCHQPGPDPVRVPHNMGFKTLPSEKIALER